jgi:hypothetical protein
MEMCFRTWSWLIVMASMLTACSGVKYVDNDTLRLIEANNAREQSANQDSAVGSLTALKSEESKPKGQFGALLVTDPNNPEDTGRMFLLKRQDKKYVAETLLNDNSDDKNAFFKQTYFSVGANQSDRSLALQLRLVF